MGEPGAGRSDFVDALERVFSPDLIRTRLPTELDFFNRETKKRAEIEVVLGDLGDELEQAFLDHLELWDRSSEGIVDELADPALIDRETYDLVVRLCYRAAWLETADQPQHWIDYPKTSNPDSGTIDYVTRAERAMLPFAVIHGRGRALEIGPRGTFRHMVEATKGDDFAPAINALEEGIKALAARFSATDQMSAVLNRILIPLRVPLRLGTAKASDIVQFLPEGGSLSGLLRSLAPAVDLQDGHGALPLHLHGSTVAGLFGGAEALASVGSTGVVVYDDFGEGLDAGSALHLAATLRRSVKQIWISTRRPEVAEAFRPHELRRFARDGAGKRKVFRGRIPRTKAQRIAARHRTLQLLPAMSSRAVIVLEGPHDTAALTSLALRLHSRKNTPLPAAYRIKIIDSGIADGSGGATGVPRLAAAARQIGLRTVAVIDYDPNPTQAEAELQQNLESADVVIRLPPRHAIELALLTDVDEVAIRKALRRLAKGFAITLPDDIDMRPLRDLIKAAIGVIKSSGGLHAQFVEALPAGVYPPVASRILETAVRAGNDGSKGLIQL